MKPVDLEQAIEVFVRGFAFTRCFTHPFTVEQVEGLWRLHDAPRARSKACRVEEWVGHGVRPEEVDRIARQHCRGRFAVSFIRSPAEPPGPIRDAFKRLGYRLNSTEPLLVHCLRRIPQTESPVEIVRVRTRELADQFGRTWHQRPLTDAQLRSDAPLRQYVAQEGGDIVGAVRSVASGAGSWVANLYVMTLHRRRGIGRALLCRLLREERRRGVAVSVLLASRLGAPLYTAVGYENIGELLLFTPRRG